MSDAISAPSPNHSDRNGTPVSIVVLHYTGMETGEAALDRLRNPDVGVSAHYMIERDGRLYLLVPEERRAHHAGKGAWAESLDVNSASIGIELVNKGHAFGYEDFPEAQMATLTDLLEGIVDRFNVPAHRIIAHSDLAPERKEDPGEKFPWARLAEKGLCLPQWSGEVPSVLPSYEDAIELMAKIGYHIAPTHPVAPVLAFQRRFAPSELGQGLSPNTRAAIAEIAGLLPQQQ